MFIYSFIALLVCIYMYVYVYICLFIHLLIWSPDVGCRFPAGSADAIGCRVAVTAGRCRSVFRTLREKIKIIYPF